ncbi:unnamed protein product [Caenorhabditis angaria]|uniref:Uncharacterized protein n=1 Tax=Caenorhabditis angaria TaxID=860376 RepID=A0A9P1IM37_9PELO|nr:unnamed protein product [Caenorhabditis angaria]
MMKNAMDKSKSSERIFLFISKNVDLSLPGAKLLSPDDLSRRSAEFSRFELRKKYAKEVGDWMQNNGSEIGVWTLGGSN